MLIIHSQITYFSFLFMVAFVSVMCISDNDIKQLCIHNFETQCNFTYCPCYEELNSCLKKMKQRDTIVDDAFKNLCLKNNCPHCSFSNSKNLDDEDISMLTILAVVGFFSIIGMILAYYQRNIYINRRYN